MEETQQSIDSLSKLSGLYISIANDIISKPNYTYRQDGWTARQVINHLVDVYLNAYLRTKWLLAEKNSVLKPYDENKFARLDDQLYNNNVDSSLQLVKLIIDHFVALLRSLPAESFDLSIYHSEYKTDYSLHKLISMYDWHGYHHLAHLGIIKNKN